MLGTTPARSVSLGQTKSPTRQVLPVLAKLDRLGTLRRDTREEVSRKSVMFDQKSLTDLFDELRDEYELEPDWEEIQRDAHLAVARVDAGQPIGNVDNRVSPLVEKHNPG